MEGTQEETDFEAIHAEGVAPSQANTYDTERRALEAEEAGDSYTPEADPDERLRRIQTKRREREQAAIGDRGLTEQVEARTAVEVPTDVSKVFGPTRRVAEPVGVSELNRLSEEGAEALLRDVTDALEGVPEDRREDVYHNLRDRAVAALQRPKGSRRAAEDFVDRYLTLPLGEQSPYTSEGMRDEKLEDLDPPPWLVEDVVPGGQVGILTGKSGVGKSWLASELTAAVAFGGDWLGHPVPEEASGHVRLFLAEGRVSFPRRLASELIRRGELERGADRSELAELLAGRVSINAGHVTLDDVRLEENLKASIRERGTRLVIFDTLNRMLSAGVSENKPDDAKGIVNMLQRVASDTGATLILIHHPPRGEGPIRERGAGPWSQGPDFRFLIYGEPEDFQDGKAMRLANLKQRDADEADDLGYYRTQWTVFYNGEESTTISLRPTSVSRRATTAELIRKYVEENPGLNQSELIKETGRSREDVTDALGRLTKAGKIRNEREGNRGPCSYHLAGEWAEEAEAEAPGFDADEEVAPDSDLTGDGGGSEQG